MQTHATITIAQAAKQLGIGSRTLFRLLRDAGVLSDTNIATRVYVAGGELRNEHRSALKRGTRIPVWYTVPLVTGKGMALLQEIASGAANESQRCRSAENAAESETKQAQRAAESARDARSA